MHLQVGLANSLTFSARLYLNRGYPNAPLVIPFFKEASEARALLFVTSISFNYRLDISFCLKRNRNSKSLGSILKISDAQQKIVRLSLPRNPQRVITVLPQCKNN